MRGRGGGGGKSEASRGVRGVGKRRRKERGKLYLALAPPFAPLAPRFSLPAFVCATLARYDADGDCYARTVPFGPYVSLPKYACATITAEDRVYEDGMR